MEVNRDRLDKIAVVGCGAVGGFYGAKLCQTGCDVHFLLRSDYKAVRENGVRIRSAEGDFDVHPTAARSPGEIGLCDLVIVALKSTANHRLGELLPPLVGEHTALLTLQNGLNNEATLAALFPNRPVFGGMCFVCLNRTKPGVIHHIAHGKIVLGRHGGSPDGLTGAIAKLIRSSGIPVDVSPDLERAHWEKLVWNQRGQRLGGPLSGWRLGNSFSRLRPTINSIIFSRVRSAIGRVSMCSPSRRMVTRSATSKISSKR